MREGVGRRVHVGTAPRFNQTVAHQSSAWMHAQGLHVHGRFGSNGDGGANDSLPPRHRDLHAHERVGIKADRVGEQRCYRHAPEAPTGGHVPLLAAGAIYCQVTRDWGSLPGSRSLCWRKAPAVNSGTAARVGAVVIVSLSRHVPRWRGFWSVALRRGPCGARDRHRDLRAHERTVRNGGRALNIRRRAGDGLGFQSEARPDLIQCRHLNVAQQLGP